MFPKTVLLISDLLDGMGGAERNLFLLATHLKTTNHLVLVACLKGGEISEKLAKEGIEVVDLNVSRVYGINGIKSIIYLMRLIKHREVDVVMTYHLGSDYIGALLSLCLHVPVISNRRDMGFDLKPRHYLFYRLLNPLFSHVCAVSQSVRKMLVDKQEMDENQITVVENGVDVALFEDMHGKKTLNIDHSNVVKICCVANVREIKGHIYLIKALAELSKKNVDCQLFLVGHYEENSLVYKELTNLIVAENIREKIIFLGPVNSRHVLPVMREMDISVLPSLSEGMSNTLIESMAARLPVVATNVGGNSEVVVDGETGFLVPPKDPSTLAAALFELISNVELRKKMGDEGFSLFQKAFSSTVMLAKYKALIRYVFVKKIKKKQIYKWKVNSFLYSIKHFYKVLIADLLLHTKIIALYSYTYRKLRGGRVMIFCLHDVAGDIDSKHYFSICLDLNLFREFLDYLSSTYRIVDLDTASRMIVAKEKLWDDVVALTFDDCFKQFSGYILQECKQRNIPYAVFVNTGPIETRKPLLYDNLLFIVANTNHKVVCLPWFKEGECFLLDRKEGVHHFVDSFFSYLIRTPLPNQREMMRELANLLDVSLDEEMLSRKILTWEDLKKLQAAGVIIGAHTKSHPLLITLSFKDNCREIAGSKECLEEKLKISVDHFSYPFGSKDSFGDEAVACVKQAGFRFAYTLFRNSSSAVNPFMIGRKNLNAGFFANRQQKFSRAMCALELSGLSEIVYAKKIKEKIKKFHIF